MLSHKPTAFHHAAISGDPNVEVQRGLLALDMTPRVLEEAQSLGASLIITHHPLIFRALSEITTRSFASNLAFQLAASGVALYSIHTNLDAASGGVSFALGKQLGLTDLEFLDTFESEGDEAGLGAVGRLDTPMLLSEFLDRVAERLDTPALRYVGRPDARIEKVAVCGGSGSDFVNHAIDAGADAYVTADVKYHAFFDVLDVAGNPRMAFVDAGHYETEAITEALLQNELAERFPEVEWLRTQHRTSPMATYVRRT